MDSPDKSVITSRLTAEQEYSPDLNLSADLESERNDPEDFASGRGQDQPERSVFVRWFSRRKGVVFATLFCVAAGGYAYRKSIDLQDSQLAADEEAYEEMSDSPANAATGSIPAGKSSHGKRLSAMESADASYRKQFIGVWKRDDDGPYEMTLREDGTGTLLYRPASTGKRLAIGNLLTVSIEWKIRNGHVDFVSISGEPKYGYEVAVAFEGGKRKHRRIERVDEHEMVLFNDKKKGPDKLSSIWKRVK